MKTELAVIGAGPAGLSAAIEAAKNGVDVTVIDENEKPGGQLFKQIHRFFGSREHFASMRGFDIGNLLLDNAKKFGVNILLKNTAWGLFPDFNIGISDGVKVDVIEANRVIVATGAIENALMFPGWTLPNIMSAGAIQTMMNIHRVLPGKRVVTIGSGNVGLIVSYQLMQAGAEIIAVVEAMPDVCGYQVHASKITRMGVPIITSSTIVEAEGENSVESVTLAKLDKNFNVIEESSFKVKADLVCIATGLRPMNELGFMVGLKFIYLSDFGGFVPIHDENMQATIDGIYVSGDGSGIEEASTAIEEGKIAGIAVSLSLKKVNEQIGNKILDEAKIRLKTLRLGPFGEHRQKANEAIIEKYYAHNGE